jgi:hypothetical protein
LIQLIHHDDTNAAFTPAEYNLDNGIPIMNIGHNESETQYCCDAVRADNKKMVCKYGDLFHLAQAYIIPDAEFLENNGKAVSSSCPSNTSITSDKPSNTISPSSSSLTRAWFQRSRQNGDQL